MDRRESLRTLLIGGAGTSLLLSCRLDEDTDVSKLTDIKEREFDYGRTPAEEARDEALLEQDFYTDEEMKTIIVLSDIIMPGDGSKPASEAGVPEFIEFITKDIPSHQTPMRGGLRWLKNESYKRYEKDFVDLSKEQQIAIIEDIAYPEDVKPEFTQGAQFFSRMRNLVTTGYFTSKEGVEYLGYMGNKPNVWDGVPADVLQKHGMKYDEKILSRSIKPEERNDIEDWEGYEI
ncbi:gluconate 2-dehydrogenase subunit 3 family protein [Gramella jeungdoensis]|uniref:Gluconate 2-dehydrogenase subunit 3 family protein n=1 Tax=Gramella jeungdoensis TaxID=708091 RepID=A0ABT0Z387_9FLAO|nr:gluconate 2-dehydrogenase subunit 3 family protein [Gramella jeungdoensis]MCM8569878.1 gluconate 2-dehydrogenase subunit 3 family protein [Gramella jeungdoensis]